jgi:hypothetical protein
MGSKRSSDLTSSVDLEKEYDQDREKSGGESLSSSGELNSPSIGNRRLLEEQDALSRVESATSAVFDIASRVPTNASRESGIIGTFSPRNIG